MSEWTIEIKVFPDHICTVCGSSFQVDKREQVKLTCDSLRSIFQRCRSDSVSLIDYDLQSLVCLSCENTFAILVDIYRQIDELNYQASELQNQVRSSFESANPDYACDYDDLRNNELDSAAKFKQLVAITFCSASRNREDQPISRAFSPSPDFPTFELLVTDESTEPASAPARVAADHDGLNETESAGVAPVVPEGPVQCKDAIIILERLSQRVFDKHMQKLEGLREELQKTPRRRKRLRKVNHSLSGKEAVAVLMCPHRPCKRKGPYPSEIYLEGHIKKAHEGLIHPFTCEECGRKFRHAKAYEDHLKAHGGQFSVICKYCNAGFIHKYQLRLHMVKHTAELPFKCDQCTRAFKGYNGLMYHKKLAHLNVRPFVCDVCGKAFVSVDHLKRHRDAVHATTKEHVCHLCGRRFAIRNYLYMHLRVHEGNPCISKARRERKERVKQQKASAGPHQQQPTCEEEQQGDQEEAENVVLISDNNTPLLTVDSNTLTAPVEGAPGTFLLLPTVEFTTQVPEEADTVSSPRQNILAEEVGSTS